MSEVKKTKENPNEMYFTWYLEELKRFGYLKYYDREPEMILVLPAFEHTRVRYYKSKDNVDEPFNMLQSTTYKYDYRLVWEEKALHLFTEPYQKDKPFEFGQPEFVSHYIKLNGDLELVSFVDVKPHISAAQFGGAKNSSYYTFPFIQKFLMATRRLYINKVIPTNQGKHGINTCLFAKTFTPTRYRHTDAGQQNRKIPFKKTTINTYAERQSAIIERIRKEQADKKAKDSQQTLL